jgi:hypothetical protein
MAMRTDEAPRKLDTDDEEWIDWFMKEIEKAMDAEKPHWERAGYWKAVADMQEGRPLRP